jgi:Type II secretion system (T2SS), protein E, N-terminal domain
VILERVARNISLLQAETVIPPLKRETDIVLGIGSYPESGPSLEQLLYYAGVTAQRFTLRPAITAQLWGVMSTMTEVGDTVSATRNQDQQKAPDATKPVGNVPFMQLPAQLPARLKHLIPYDIALELRCVPVGRDHQYLTVAMADPNNIGTVHRLREITGLTIFPVSCDISALNALLINKWK